MSIATHPATLTAAAAAALYYFYCKYEEARLDELFELADAAVRQAEFQMHMINEALHTDDAVASLNASALDENRRSVVYRGLEVPPGELDDEDDGENAPPLSPVRPRRFKSEDYKKAVHHVMMPKLMEHNHTIGMAKKALRERRIGRGECRQQVQQSARAFDMRYAETIRAAKELAHELPPGADLRELPLRRLVSSEQSWARVQELRAQLERITSEDEVEADNGSG